MELVKKINYQAVFTEIVTIVVGILLALAANEWNSNRLANQKLNVALSSVKQELLSNQQIMRETHRRNLLVLEKLQSQKDQYSEQQQTFIPGLQVRNTSWKTLLDSGVTDSADIRLLQSLHEHYAILDMYKTLSYQTIQMILNTKALMADKPKNGMNPVFNESIFLIVELEKALIQSLEVNLKKMELIKTGNS